jgi:PAS domain S-box-containing protein
MNPHRSASDLSADAMYRLLVERCRDGVFLADPDGGLMFANGSCRQMLGYSADELKGLNLRQLCLPAETATLESALSSVRGGPCRQVVLELRRKDGTCFPAEVSLQWLTEGWVQGVFRDITERKLAEEVLARDRQLLRTLIETIPDRIYAKDADARFLLNNAAHLRALGAKSQDEALGKTDFDFRPAEFAERCMADDQAVLQHGQSLNNREEKTPLPSGERVWTLATKVPLRDADGKVIGLVGITRDITELKRVEEALAYERDLLAALMGNTPDFIYFKDRQSRFIRISRALAGHFGLHDPAEAVGKTDFDFFTKEHAQQAFDDEQRILRTGQPIVNQEERETHRDGRVTWVLTSKEPLRDADGKIIGTFGISRDITELKAANEKLRLYAARLEASNRDLQDFAYVASHDLQEPLRKIQAFGDRLRAKCGDALSETGRDYLARMSDAAARMQTLINDLLSFSRVTTKAQPFAPVDLDKVLREVLSDLEVRIEQTGARVETGPLGAIDADALQMRQLLQNLIGNALKFHKENEPPVIRVTGQRLNGEWPPRLQITVTDNGIGFEPKYADRIFGIFQRLHGRGQYEGSGVGLAICKKIAERHGGVITAQSAPGDGATFVVTLPVEHSKEEPS